MAVIANDFTVLASTNAETNLRKTLQFKAQVKEKACVPLIWLGESGGARMPDCQGAKEFCTLSGGGVDTLAPAYTHLRKQPFIFAAMGECYGVPDWHYSTQGPNVREKAIRILDYIGLADKADILMHKVIVDLSIYFFENVEASVPMVKKTLGQHRQIVDLLNQGEFEEAGRVCFQHIEDVRVTIVEKSKQQSLLVLRRIWFGKKFLFGS